jgi:hypothetical protein
MEQRIKIKNSDIYVGRTWRGGVHREASDVGGFVRISSSSTVTRPRNEGMGFGEGLESFLTFSRFGNARVHGWEGCCGETSYQRRRPLSFLQVDGSEKPRTEGDRSRMNSSGFRCCAYTSEGRIELEGMGGAAGSLQPL